MYDVVQYLNHSVSDHTPLLLNTSEKVDNKSRPFKFFNHLVENKNFITIVMEQWAKSTGARGFIDINLKL